jgi:hypothetical protein
MFIGGGEASVSSQLFRYLRLISRHLSPGSRRAACRSARAPARGAEDDPAYVPSRDNSAPGRARRLRREQRRNPRPERIRQQFLRHGTLLHG